MIRPRWSARPGRGGIMNSETATRTAGHLIHELLSGPDMTGAPCTTTDPNLWYPEKGRNDQSKVAQTLCRGGELSGRYVPPCPVRAACLARALDGPDEYTHFGIWGGYTVKQIRRLRQVREAIRQAACNPPKQGVRSETPPTEGASHGHAA